MTTANRLAAENSPYLLQHAHNPVDWWPWGDEAFDEARRRDVPVLVSVGYSACHWCHVMAHESFEDPEVAAALNQGFVAVKVDREERPDVDAVYMEAVQLVTGTGGWPMTVVTTPGRRPFWAGTYLPKQAFLQLLADVKRAWDARRQAIDEDAEQLSRAVAQVSALPTPQGEARAQLPNDALERSARAVLARQDPEWGGSNGAPKFPQPTSLQALARWWWRSGDDAAGAALTRWLDAMSSGGIYDHLGGGFARYSTDRHWLVPHFEKMLYDNALLVRAYTEAWQLTRSPRYRQVVEETVQFLLSPPVRLPEGAWASAQDADSEGEEGRFYTWSYDELVAVGGPEATAWYGATPEGNWEGRNILWRPGVGDVERPAPVEQARHALLAHRALRSPPGLDAKVLTEWNAMAVAALAGAGRAFGRPAWVEAATSTAEMLLGRLQRADGRWLRSWLPGSTAKHLACAADYAWLTDAFTRLGEATGRSRWTDVAQEAANGLIDLFWDPEEGAFFTAGSDAEPLLARLKDVFDGAVPSANAAAAQALARLGALSGVARYSEVARAALRALVPSLDRAPGAFPGTAVAADMLSSPGRQVVVNSKSTELVQEVWSRYLPDTVLAWGEAYPSPLWEGRTGPGSQDQAFVCEGYTCKLPVGAAHDLAALLQRPGVSTVDRAGAGTIEE